MVRRARLIAVGGPFLIGCAVLLMLVGCAGVRSEAPDDQEKQGRDEATNKEQARSPEATASEEDRCSGTRTIDLLKSSSVGGDRGSSVQPGDPEALFVTNDVPGCPTGGPLSGTDKPDRLAGREGEDEVRGLGGSDLISGWYGSDTNYGGSGNDELQAGAFSPLEFTPPEDRSDNVLHGGPGRDFMSGAAGDDVLYGGDGDEDMLWGGGGEDVLYGGDGDDYLDASDDGHRDKLYCGEGKDDFLADKIDYVDSTCEVKRETAF